MSHIHVETPCISSTSLSRKIGKDVFLKLENCQPTGSFKLRGIGTLCSEAAKNKVSRFVSSSGGNAGLAAAYSARLLKIPITVYVPETTPEFMRDKIKSEGAEVKVIGKIWDEANAAALQDVSARNAFYISPFDHPTIWDGNATMIDELKNQVGKPGLVAVAVGGGGLLCGVLEGLSRCGWKDVPILACETEGTASFSATLKARKLVTLPGISGVASSLGARTVTAKLLEWIGKHPIDSLVVTDKEAVGALFYFLDDHRFLVEPACGAALASAYDNRITQKISGPVVLIVCGGAVVSGKKLEEWKMLLEQ